TTWRVTAPDPGLLQRYAAEGFEDVLVMAYDVWTGADDDTRRANLAATASRLGLSAPVLSIPSEVPAWAMPSSRHVPGAGPAWLASTPGQSRSQAPSDPATIRLPGHRGGRNSCQRCCAPTCGAPAVQRAVGGLRPRHAGH